MKGVALMLVAGVTLAWGQGPVAPGKTVSESGQFIVHGSSLPVRSGVATLAEGVATGLAKEVGEGPLVEGQERPGWQHPIVVQLDEDGSNPMRAGFLILPNGFRLQLDVSLARGINREALEHKLLELLMYERGLRGRDPDLISEELFIPPWLIDGLREAVRWRAQEADRDLYKVLFERNAVLPVDELLSLESIDDLDGASRASFRVSSGALVMGLLAQDGGRDAMGDMLAAAATYEGDAPALLRKFFPGMNLGAKSLQKWWALQLARMAEPDLLSTLTIPASDRELSKILVIRVALGGEGVPPMEIHPEHYRDLLAIPSKQRRESLEVVVSEVNTFYIRAFPAYRPIIEGYLGILAELARDRDEQVDQRLADLQAQRDALVARGTRLFDMLNWYRIGTAYEVSGAFADYQELKQRLDAQRHRKRADDPVSSYLDQVEVLFAVE